MLKDKFFWANYGSFGLGSGAVTLLLTLATSSFTPIAGFLGMMSAFPFAYLGGYSSSEAKGRDVVSHPSPTN